mmetsp:Transcript_17207/g.59377  ORF Transcript_17207/g.59377 Transcript_17207/m.59377 type:complete len:85 (-) Transcript_17207:766-1020(-)
MRHIEQTTANTDARNSKNTKAPSGEFVLIARVPPFFLRGAGDGAEDGAADGAGLGAGLGAAAVPGEAARLFARPIVRSRTFTAK